MDQRKKVFGIVSFAATTQIAFWVVYTQTGNITGSIAITAGIGIALGGLLRWLGKVDQHKKQSQ